MPEAPEITPKLAEWAVERECILRSAIIAHGMHIPELRQAANGTDTASREAAARIYGYRSRQQEGAK